MPVYEYRCRRCQKIFSEERRMADRKNPARCPECNVEETDLVISRGGFILAGDGWAAQGYSAGGKK